MTFLWQGGEREKERELLVGKHCLLLGDVGLNKLQVRRVFVVVLFFLVLGCLSQSFNMPTSKYLQYQFQQEKSFPPFQYLLLVVQKSDQSPVEVGSLSRYLPRF